MMLVMRMIDPVRRCVLPIVRLVVLVDQVLVGVKLNLTYSFSQRSSSVIIVLILVSSLNWRHLTVLGLDHFDQVV